MPDVIGSPLQPGATFLGRYQIVRCINAGGMGAVYEVIHIETKRHRALKVMLPSILSDPDMRARFKQEASITAEIDTEHIVETFDAGVEPETGVPFLVMELLKGEDVAAHLQKRGRIPASEVIVLLQQLAVALDKTHAAGIVHRDLKPENLFITQRDDGSPRLKVLDFGIAKVVAQGTKVNATRSVGTPLYMSPEQLHGDGAIGPRADLYAMGHIGYAMLVGQAYWEEEASASDSVWPLLVKVMAGVKEPPSARALRRGVRLKPSFDRWFATATAPRPQDRFATASYLVAALGEVLGVEAPRAPLGWSGSPYDSLTDVAGVAYDSLTDVAHLAYGAGPGVVVTSPGVPKAPETAGSDLRLDARSTGTEVLAGNATPWPAPVHDAPDPPAEPPPSPSVRVSAPQPAAPSPGRPVVAATGPHGANGTFSAMAALAHAPPRRSVLPFVALAIALLAAALATMLLVRGGIRDSVGAPAAPASSTSSAVAPTPVADAPHPSALATPPVVVPVVAPAATASVSPAVPAAGSPRAGQKAPAGSVVATAPPVPVKPPASAVAPPPTPPPTALPPPTPAPPPPATTKGTDLYRER